jgi:hypothetical protein
MARKAFPRSSKGQEKRRDPGALAVVAQKSCPTPEDGSEVGRSGG